MNQEERERLQINDGIICDNGDRGIITELSSDHKFAFVQWEINQRLWSAATLKYGINPLSLSESRSLAFELAVAEALSR